MPLPDENAEMLRAIARGTSRTPVDVLGTTLEFLVAPGDAGDGPCVMRDVMPPGVVVPLQRHTDAEAFLVLSGAKQVLLPGARGLEWIDVSAGDYVQVLRSVRQAHPAEPVQRAGRRPGDHHRQARTLVPGGRQAGDGHAPAAGAGVLEVSARYGYWLGSPEANAAVGIELPGPVPPGRSLTWHASPIRPDWRSRRPASTPVE